MSTGKQIIVPRSLCASQDTQNDSGPIISIENGIGARIKDPLWFLARQWQMGEFEASNGGMPVSMTIKASDKTINGLFAGQKEVENIEAEVKTNELRNVKPTTWINNSMIPLEAIVESGTTDVNGLSLDITKELPDASPAWNPKRLEYNFAIGAGNKKEGSDEYDPAKVTLLNAHEYYGEAMDWYSFIFLKEGEFSEDEDKTITMKDIIPTAVSFPGMPKSRWWEFEDAQVDMGNIRRPNLNFLSMLLTEFGLLFSNDWFIIPLGQHINTIRKIISLKVADTFGEKTPIYAHEGSSSGFNLFTLSKNNNLETTSSQYFFLPNNIIEAVESQPLEEVVISRDEHANLVWAMENKYFDGEVKNREDEEPADTSESLTHSDKTQYKIKSDLPMHWIPYIPVHFGSDNAQIILRRARTLEDASQKQFKGKIIDDSIKIMEEEIPSIPIDVSQHVQAVTYKPDDFELLEQNGKFSIKFTPGRKQFIWIGRKKKQAAKKKSSRLLYDYLSR